MQPFNEALVERAQRVEEQIAPYRKKREDIAFYNQRKVLAAFRENRVSDFHLTGSTGYGYDDSGRDTLEDVYAMTFGAEDCLVRGQIVSGTHAISIALFGVLRPGDELLYITGEPYDTLASIVDGGEQDTGSLKDLGISYQHVDLLDDESVDFEEVERRMTDRTKVVAIQRSRGYSSRHSFLIEEIEEMIQRVRAIREDVIVFVDNCYGEFSETKEPTEVGADLMAGSL